MLLVQTKTHAIAIEESFIGFAFQIKSRRGRPDVSDTEITSLIYLDHLITKKFTSRSKMRFPSVPVSDAITPRGMAYFANLKKEYSMRFYSALSLLAFGLALHSYSFAQGKLPSSVEAQLKKAELPASSLSVIAMPANQGAAILHHQADRAFAPASTMKLLTSFIALDKLGPAYKWKTQFLTEDSVQEGVLNGKLYLRGGGDPNLSFEKFGLMLRALRQTGLRQINGELILDRQFFQPNRPEIGAPAFDENPDAYYNVIPDALLIHSNITAFMIDSSNDKVNLRLATPMDGIALRNQLKLNNRPCNEWKTGWQSPQVVVNVEAEVEIVANGSFPKNCQTIAYLNILDRNAYIGSMFKALWTELGGEWNGKVSDGITPSNAKLLHERQSESLADTLRIINKFSDNAMARISFLTLGAESTFAKQLGDSNLAANTEVRNWFTKNKLSDQGLIIENGSGLSRIDRISALQLASILRIAHNSFWQAEFASSLPIVALDGSMKNRLKASAAEGRARIKTGTLRNVMAIAGYVRDPNQQDWILVAFINTEDASAMRGKAVLDELINWLASGQASN